MGINPKGCFLGGMGKKSLVFFNEIFFWWCGMGCLEKVGFFLFFKEIIFWWCGMGCLEKVDVFFLL